MAAAPLRGLAPPPGVPSLLTRAASTAQATDAPALVAEACGQPERFFRLDTARADGTRFDSWNVRREPSRTADVLRTLQHGTIIGVASFDASEAWLKLDRGWVLQEMDGAGWRPCADRSAASARATAQTFAALCSAARRHGPILLGVLGGLAVAVAAAVADAVAVLVAVLVAVAVHGEEEP